MKIVWMSDIHLNFLKDAHPFFEEVKKMECDHIIISGDIAESHNVISYIEDMEFTTNKPIHFVLGNHDFYGSSIKKVKKSVRHLNWIPRNYGTPLSDKTIIIGADSWGDCRNGDFENSHLTMSDWLYIEELNTAYLQGQQELKRTLQKFADADARAIKRKALKAIKNGYTHIIIVSHVPPFEEASYNAGRKSTPSGLPFFSSKILGELITPIAKKNPDIKFTWLCGHTHSKVTLNILKNFVVKVAPSEYFIPQVAEVIEYD